MMRLIKFLIFGHVCNWETISALPVSTKYGETVGDIYHLRCKNCGNVKGKVIKC
jgi:hypothetical protein